jgi:hypothetical protein
MTVGPWKPITLEAYGNRIVDVDIRARVDGDLSANLVANVTFAERKPGFMSFTLSKTDGSTVASTSATSTDLGQAKVSLDFPPGKLNLWYPAGYGKQSLYTVSIKLTDEVMSFSTLVPLKFLVIALHSMVLSLIQKPRLLRSVGFASSRNHYSIKKV